MISRFNRTPRKIKPVPPDKEFTESTTSRLPNDMSEQTSGQTNINSSGFHRPLIYSVLLVSVFVLGLISGFLIWGGSTPVAANTPEAEQQQVTRYSIEEGGNPSIGPADAPITIIEFSDYQCPYCQKWESEVFQRLLDEYPTQVRIVYRDFPLNSLHPQASSAANAANCAGEQDSYFLYHDKLFSYDYDLGKDTYLTYARELKLDMNSFTACLESDRYAEEVSADISYAVELGIQSTPTFFINGLYMVGAQPYETFKKLIDQELAGEIP